VRPNWALILILGLAGCSSDPHSMFVSPDAITAPIYALKGSSIDTATAYLGLPDREIKLDGGRRTVVWTGAANSAAADPHNSVTDWNGNRFASPAPYCIIKAIVGGSNKIESVKIETNSAFYCPRGKGPAPLRGSL
jgi:hypothetical protein